MFRAPSLISEIVNNLPFVQNQRITWTNGQKSFPFVRILQWLLYRPLTTRPDKAVDTA